MLALDIDQRSDDWRAWRLGQPTASKASQLVTSAAAPSKSMASYADELAADLFAGNPIGGFAGNRHTERGLELEPVARAAYAYTHDVDVIEAGFVSDALCRFGCSPDGLVGNDGLLEIKCCEAKGHVKALLYWREKHRPPPDYVPQAAFQMLVTDRAWCDIYYYHPDLPSIAMRVGRSAEMDDALLSQIDACIARRDDTLAALRGFAPQPESAA